MLSDPLQPVRASDDFWQRADVVNALQDRDFGALFRLLRQHTGASQTRIGSAVGMPQGEISMIMSKGPRQRRVTALDVIARIADGLDLPDHARKHLGLAHRRPTDIAQVSSSGPQEEINQLQVSPALRTEDESEEFVSVPVQTPNGVVAYIVTRRAFLSTLSTAVLTLTSQGQATAHADLLAMGSLPFSSHDVLDRHPAESSNGFLQVTRLLASQRQAIAPDALLSLVNAHRDCLVDLFRKAATDPVRMDIGALLGETSIVASRLWSAKGNRALALASCAYARQLADKLNNPLLGATARIFESNLHSEAATLIGADGDLVLGLQMLEEASTVGHSLGPAARARVAAEQAQAYAVLSLRNESRQALGRARKAVAEIREPDQTGLFSDWSPSRLLVYEGTCLLFLGEPNKAITVLTDALRESGSDVSNANVQLAAQVDLASAYAESGELGEGCNRLADAYARLVALGNHRGIERARYARQRLSPWDGEPVVRELDERIKELTPAP